MEYLDITQLLNILIRNYENKIREIDRKLEDLTIEVFEIKLIDFALGASDDERTNRINEITTHINTLSIDRRKALRICEALKPLVNLPSAEYKRWSDTWTKEIETWKGSMR